MSDPTPTPACEVGGVASHERFYANLSKIEGKTIERPRGATQQFTTAATTARIAENAKASATPAEAPVDHVAEFDREQRAAGNQTMNFEKDPKAEAYLMDLFRKQPDDQRRGKWRETWERDLRQVYEGRMMGETPAAFKARQDAAKDPTAGAALPDAPHVEAPPERVQQAVDHLAKVADIDGFAGVGAFHKSVLSGYRLPTLVQNQTYHAEEVIAKLHTARAAGMSQAQVDAFIRADLKSKGFKV